MDILVENITVPNGIALYNGVLKYDSDKIQVEVMGSEAWELYYEKDSNITLARKDLENKTEDAILGKIIIKAKEDTEINNNIIKLVNNEITDGERAFVINDTNIEKQQLKINFGEYEEEENYLENIKPKTTIEQLIKQIDTNAEIKIYKNEELVTDYNVNIGTGMKLKLTLNGEDIKEYIIVVIGDINGDGLMTDIDLLKIIRYRANIDKDLSQECLRAADIFKDKIYADDKDLLKLVRILVGLDKL